MILVEEQTDQAAECTIGINNAQRLGVLSDKIT